MYASRRTCPLLAGAHPGSPTHGAGHLWPTPQFRIAAQTLLVEDRLRRYNPVWPDCWEATPWLTSFQFAKHALVSKLAKPVASGLFAWSRKTRNSPDHSSSNPMLWPLQKAKGRVCISTRFPGCRVARCRCPQGYWRIWAIASKPLPPTLRPWKRDSCTNCSSRCHRDSEIASAEMVMGTLVYREIELRRRRGTGGNVLPFPGLVTPPIQQ